MKWTITTILCLLGSTAFAKTTLYCSHSELCKMANSLIKEYKINDLLTQNLVNISGDPHEYEPSSAEIKNLLSAGLLLSGPSELNPWIKKVNFQRSKNPALKTISLNFDKDSFLLKQYPKATTEALSHFWLYPKVYCSLKEKLFFEFKKNLVQNQFSTNNKLICETHSIEESLKVSLNKIKLPMILTHDALLPLINSMVTDQTVVAIKGSSHHEEVSTISIKKMYDALSSPKVIWIIETGIDVPQNILNKIRKNDLVIKIDTSQSSDSSPFSALLELSSKLNAIAEKKQ